MNTGGLGTGLSGSASNLDFKKWIRGIQFPGVCHDFHGGRCTDCSYVCSDTDFLSAGNLLGANPAMLAGALISGIFFGDAVSPSSQVINTTVMIQHDGVTGQPADLLKT